MENIGIEELVADAVREHDELGKIILPVLEKYRLPEKEVLEVCQIGKFVYKLDSGIRIEEKSTPPDPDFIISRHNQLIGLEHTRIYTDNAENYNRVSALIHYAEKLFTLTYPGVLVLAQISVTNDTLEFRKSERHALASEIVEYIFNLYNGSGGNRPIFISKAKVAPHTQVSFCYLEKNWQAPYLTKERLATEIRKKEAKIDSYKTGNEDISAYWLVLFIGSLSSVSYRFDPRENYAAESRFDHVYLMIDFEAEIVRIC